MTPQPLRKTYRRPDLGVVHAAKQFEQQAAEIELGWLTLREHLHDTGWPARTPEDDRKDRKPRLTHTCMCGQRFASVDEWTWHRDETGHDQVTETPPPESSALDYADPTGDQATEGAHLGWHRDLERLQNLRANIERDTKAMASIAAKYRPLHPGGVPICSVGACDEAVESRVSPHTGKVGYVGMEQIAGCWMPKVGVAPECRRHRAQRERADAA